DAAGAALAGSDILGAETLSSACEHDVATFKALNGVFWHDNRVRNLAAAWQEPHPDCETRLQRTGNI
ncbi:hypothetical protein ABTE36_23805, partial [Acinetobacter baumannii]